MFNYCYGISQKLDESATYSHAAPYRRPLAMVRFERSSGSPSLQHSNRDAGYAESHLNKREHRKTPCDVPTAAHPSSTVIPLEIATYQELDFCIFLIQ